MAGTPEEEDLELWHRRFAVEANNRAWSLTERPALSVDERSELLHAAHAAAHHWTKIGTEAQVALADLLLGRTYALLGHAALAMTHARAAFDSICSRDSAPWETAFAHAVLANAAAVSGDRGLHARHYAEAKTLGGQLSDPEDRAVFAATFTLVPDPESLGESGGTIGRG